MNDEAYDGLVSLIYQCVLDDDAWLTLLGRLAEVSGRRYGSLFLWDRGNGQTPKASTISLCTPEVLRDYDQYYGAIDPAQPFMVERGCGSWYHDVRDYGQAGMARDPFYQDFFQAHELGISSAVKLHEHDGAGVYLSLLSTRGAAMPSAAQQHMLDRLSQHLRQSARLSNRITRLELGIAQRDLLLEQSQTAQWLVDAEGRVLYCNGTAERRMSEPTFPLRERQGRLTSTQGALTGLLRTACGKSGPKRAVSLRLPQLDGELLIAPVRSDGRLRLDTEHPLALVALLAGQPKATLLADLFACTPAEIRLAELITRGSSPEECAARLGVSINTVRSQLRALFCKTDTERQGELVGLLARLG